MELNKTGIKWSLFTLAGVAVAAGAAVAAVVAGAFDTAATAAWPQPVAWLIHRTMIDSVRARASSVVPPAGFTPEQVRAGFQVYDAHCAMCHGGPGVSRQPWVAGLEPTAPYLIDVRRLFSRPELYWVVRNGVKMTAMPAWRDRLSEGETWDVVAFLEALPGMTPAQYARLRAAAPPLAQASTKPAPVGEAPRAAEQER